MDKVCCICKKLLSEDSFYVGSKKCIPCEKEHKRKYYLKNREQIREKVHAYKSERREEIAAKSREYYYKNRDVILVKNRERKRNRLKNDPVYRLVENLRNRLRKAVYGQQKSSTTMELIGCTREELIVHLESQFQEGMSMDNYGEWHLDHIVPCCKFDLSDPEQQKKCFHYTNIQPLWAEDNQKKGGK